MKQIFVTFVLIITFVFHTIGQKVGTIKNTEIDDVFLSTLQFVHPEFAFSPDSLDFTKRLFKSYILPEAYADTARKLGLDTDPEIKRQLEIVKRLAENNYLAMIYQKYQVKKIDITDAEAKKYYDENWAQFTEPGTYSFLQAYISDTSSTTIKKVKELLSTYSKMGSSLDQFKIGAEGQYSINYEKNLTLRPADQYYQYLKNAKPNELIGPITMDKNKIMLVLIEMTQEKSKSFYEVKEICRQNANMEKSNRKEIEFRKKTADKYPIKLNKEYFGEKK